MISMGDVEVINKHIAHDKWDPYKIKQTQKTLDTWNTLQSLSLAVGILLMMQIDTWSWSVTCWVTWSNGSPNMEVSKILHFQGILQIVLTWLFDLHLWSLT